MQDMGHREDYPLQLWSIVVALQSGWFRASILRQDTVRKAGLREVSLMPNDLSDVG